MKEIKSSDQIDFLLSSHAVRTQSSQIFELNINGEGYFNYHPSRWDDVVDYVAKVTLDNYPDLNIPFHSRLRHFMPDDKNRIAILEKPKDIKTLFDLIIISVLLDAGAGDSWSYHERETDRSFSRSEGLGVASFWMFKNGMFDEKRRQEVSRLGLEKLLESDLAEGFQVGAKNNLVGFSHRFELLKKLSSALENRPSDLFEDFFTQKVVSAPDLLKRVLRKIGPIWPNHLFCEGVALGDTWIHPKLEERSSYKFIPFHKISQWMTYSLLDALILCGHEIENVDHLTGLPEYRNGGLFLDMGLITPRDENQLTCGVKVDDLFTIEWRAMTVVLLDMLAEKVRSKLKMNRVELPLVKILEGGTWSAGRKIASQRRAKGLPPVNIISDGVYF